LHRRGVERVNCGPKLLDLGEKGVYSSYTSQNFMKITQSLPILITSKEISSTALKTFGNEALLPKIMTKVMMNNTHRIVLVIQGSQ
ncbi:TPA: hypothetical protein ACGFE6_005295, partial [Escherichia coli]